MCMSVLPKINITKQIIKLYKLFFQKKKKKKKIDLLMYNFCFVSHVLLLV